MIAFIELENFKSFDHIIFDIRKKNKEPKQFCLIYGENGSGKSNLMSSFFFLSEVFSTLFNQEKLNKLNENGLTNALMEIKDEDLKKALISNVFHTQMSSLSTIIQENLPVNFTENQQMSMKIGFYLDGKHGEYLMKFSKEKIIYEECSYVINERLGKIFSISVDTIFLSPSIFKTNAYKKELLDLLEKYWGIHAFSSIMINEMQMKNKKFFDKRLEKNFLSILLMLHSISVSYKHEKGTNSTVTIHYHFLKELEKGYIKKKDDAQLRAFELSLNSFFTELYSDIKKVYYKIEDESEYGFQYQLFEQKLINNSVVDISFSQESTGTRKLLELFPFFFAAMDGHTIIVDEMDSGIHDIMIASIMNELRDSIKGQFIATTHNTLLMKYIPIEDIYILSSLANGTKEIIPLNEYQVRVQKTHNVQSKYLNGDFGGIPFIGNLDFNDIMDNVSQCLKDN